MATGFASAYADKALDALCGNANWSHDGDPYIQLHTGDPGAAGTSNVASETDRVQASFSAASAGAITNDAEVEWLAVAATETYTHFTAWTQSSGGSFMFSGTLSNGTVTSGGDFTIGVGDLDVSLTIAS